jgi:hypothetical protein
MVKEEVQQYLLAEVLSALDIFGFGFVSLFSVLLSVREAVPRPRPVPLDPAADISLKNNYKDVTQTKLNQEANHLCTSDLSASISRTVWLVQ